MPIESVRNPRLHRAFLLLPPLFLLGWLLAFGGSNVPWGDDVSMSPLYEKFYTSTLTFNDLWEPYQGHRLFFHRSLELLLGLLTHWNTACQLGFIYVTFLCDFALIYWLLQDLRPAVSPRVWFTLAVVMSLSIFSASQEENWTNGWQISLTLSVLCVLSGVTVLAKFGARPWALFLSLLAGVIATYSFGTGLTYWGALAPLLYVKLRDDPRWPLKALSWVAVAGGVIFFYFHHLGNSGTSTGLGQSVLGIARLPGTFLTYLLTCMGASVFFLNGAKAGLSPTVRLLVAAGAPVCGGLGLAALGAAVWRLLRLGGPGLARMAPWASLGLYSLCSVGITCLARYTFAPESALASRYITYSQYFWLALFVFLALLAPQVPPWRRRGLGTVLVICYLISYGNGLRHARKDSVMLRQVRVELLGQPTTQTYALINPDRTPAELADDVEIMRRRRLALFHDAALP